MTPDHSTLSAALAVLETGPTLDAIATVFRAKHDDLVAPLTDLWYLLVLIGVALAALPLVAGDFSKPIERSINEAVKIMSTVLRFGLLGSLLLFIGSLLPSGPLPWPLIGIPLGAAVALIVGISLSLAVAFCLHALVTSSRQSLEWAQVRKANRAAIDDGSLTSAERQLILARGFGGGGRTLTPAIVTDLLLPDSRTTTEHLFSGAKSNPVALIGAFVIFVMLCVLIRKVDHGDWYAVTVFSLVTTASMTALFYNGYTITKARRAVEAERAANSSLASTPAPDTPTASPA